MAKAYLDNVRNKLKNSLDYFFGLHFGLRFGLAINNLFHFECQESRKSFFMSEFRNFSYFLAI